VSDLGASEGILDSFLIDSLKVFIDRMERFVHANMNKLDMCVCTFLIELKISPPSTTLRGESIAESGFQ
jgi:hypothetical protein